jgi:putative transposase
VRHKFCLVEAENYLLHVYRYIELNSVRAEMVNTPSAYKYFSYQINGLGKVSDLCTPHALYLTIDHSAKGRKLAYQELFKDHVDGASLAEIRDATNKG